MARPLRRAPGCKRSPLLRQLCRRRVNGCSFATSAAPSAARGVPRAPRLSPAGRTVLDLVRPAKVCGSRVEPPCVGRGRGRRCVSSWGSRLLLRPFQLGLCWRPAREAPGWGGGGGSSASPTGRAGRSGGGRPCFPAGLPSGRLCPVASGRGNSELGLARAPLREWLALPGALGPEPSPGGFIPFVLPSLSRLLLLLWGWGGGPSA